MRQDGTGLTASKANEIEAEFSPWRWNVVI